MSGNLGESTLFLSVDDSKLISGLAKALSATRTTGDQMASLFGKSGSTAGTGFGQNAANAVKSASSVVAAAATAAANSSVAGVGSAGGKAGQAFSKSLVDSVQSGASQAASAVVRPFLGVGKSIGDTIKSQTGNIGRGMGERIGQNITDGLISGLAGVAGALGNIKNLGDFDAAARKASTLTDDIGALKKGAFELAKELKNTASATQILNAAEPVLSSGVTRTTDVLKVLKAAQIGATGGFSDIATVADATTTVMASFGLSADRAMDIVQGMAGVQNAGKIQIGEYASQVGKLTGTVALVGGSFDRAGLSMLEVNGIISNATAKGVRVSSAFDGIRQAISSIADPSEKAKTEAARLGIQFDAVTLQSKGLIGILKSLAENKGAAKEMDAIAAASAKAAKAAGGINTDAGKAAAAAAGQEAAKSAASMLKLFGSVEAVSALAASSGKQGLLDLAKAMEVVAKTDPNTAFEKVRGGINKLQEAFGNKAIDLDVKIKDGLIGEVLLAGLGIANRAMDGLISTVERLNQAYANLSPQAQGIVQSIGAVAGIATAGAVGVVAFGAAAAMMGGAISAGIGLLASMAAGVGTVLVAVAPIAVPIAAAAAAVYALSKAFGATDGEAFRNSLIAIGAGLAVLFGPAAIGAVTAGVTALVTGFGSIAVAATAALIPLLPWIAAAAGVAAALYALKVAYDNNKESIDGWLAGVVKAIAPAMDAIKNFGAAALAFAKSWFDGWMSAGRVIVDFGAGFLAALKPVADWLGNYFATSFKNAGAILNLVFAAIGKAFELLTLDLRVKGAIINSIAQGVAAIFKWVADRAGEYFRFIQSKVTELVTGFRNAQSQIGSAMQSIASQIVSGVQRSSNSFPILGAVISGAIQWFRSLGLNIQLNLAIGQKAIEGFVNIGKSLLDGLGNVIRSIGDGFNALPNTINRAADAIRNFRMPSFNGGGSPTSASPAGPASASSRYMAPGGGIEVAGSDLSGLGLGQLLAQRPSGGIAELSAAVDRAIAERASSDTFRRLYSDALRIAQGGVTDSQARELAKIHARITAAQRSGSSARGASASSSGVRISSPIANQTLEQAKRNTTQYGASRRGGRIHNKTDFVGVPGTPVLAIMDGTATLEGPSKWYGGVSQAAVRFQSDDKKTTARYYHLDKKTRELFGNQNSMRVRAGQRVGYVGADGDVPRSVGPHLDLDLRVNGKPVTFGQFAQLMGSATDASRSTATPDLAPAAAGSEDAKLQRALANAQRDRAAAAEELARTRNERKTERYSEDTRRTRRGRGGKLRTTGRASRLIGKPQSELDADYREKVARAEERLRDADDKLLSAQEAIVKARKDAAEEARRAAISEVQTRASSITSNTNTKLAVIDRQVAEGRQAMAEGRPFPATAITADEGIIRKNKLLAEQSLLVDGLIPQVARLQARYTDPESQQSLQQVLQTIQQLGTTAAESATQIAQVPFADLERSAARILAVSEREQQGVRNQRALGNIESDLEMERQLLAIRLKTSDSLDLLKAKLVALSAVQKDPAIKESIDSLLLSVQTYSAEAVKASNELSRADEIAAASRARALGDEVVKSGADQQARIEREVATGNLSELAAARELLAIKEYTAEVAKEQLATAIALRETLTDRAAIDTATEYIGSLEAIVAEAEAAAYAHQKAAYEASMLGQIAKGLTESIGTGLQDLARSAFNGFKDFNSILDSILNKVADIGFDALIGGIGGGGKSGSGLLGLVGSVFGLAHGTKSVPNYARGNSPVGEAMRRERAISGKRPYLAVLHENEAVLSTLTGDAQLYQTMQRDGRWNEIKRTENFARGTPMVSRSSSVSRGSGNNTVTVDRINSVDYVSVEQLNQILTIELPLAAQGGASLVDQKMRSPGQRARWGI